MIQCVSWILLIVHVCVQSNAILLSATHVYNIHTHIYKLLYVGNFSLQKKEESLTKIVEIFFETFVVFTMCENDHV